MALFGYSEAKSKSDLDAAMMLRIFFSILLLSKVSFAEKNFSDQMKENFDTQALNELLEKAPIGDCRNPEYVEQVRFFLASSADYQRFSPASTGAFLVHRVEALGGKPAPINLNPCFVEAMFFAIIPDVIKVNKQVREDRKFLVKIWAEFAINRGGDSLKDTKDVQAVSVSKQASFANTLLSMSQIRSCDFQNDPYMYVAATTQLQAFIDRVFSGMGSLAYAGGDQCISQLYKADPQNYLNRVVNRLNELWVR